MSDYQFGQGRRGHDTLTLPIPAPRARVGSMNPAFSY